MGEILIGLGGNGERQMLELQSIHPRRPGINVSG